jgi:hypothetical protein
MTTIEGSAGEKPMATKKLGQKRTILMPKVRGKLSWREIDRAVKKVKAEREQRAKERQQSNGQA